MNTLDNIDVTHWHHILDAMPNPITLNKKAIDENGVVHDEITFVNKAFINLIGYTLADLPTDTVWFEKAYPDEEYRNYIFKEWFRLVAIANENNTTLLGFPAKVRCKDSIDRWFQVTTCTDYNITDDYHLIVFVKIQTPEDTVLSLQSTAKELQENKEELAKQLNLVKDIIDTVPVRIFWKDRQGVYLGANKLFLQDAKLDTVDDIIGKNDFEMPWGDTEAELYRDDDLNVMNNDISSVNFEESQTDGDGNELTLLTSKVPLKDDNSTIIGVLGTYTDISQQRKTENELKEQKNKLHYQAHHDVLTGLPNRILFNDRLAQAIETAKRNKSKLAVLFIDLDNFKEINDSLGHDIGDEVLKKVASLLHSSIRDKDTISRFGGDEFSVILEDLDQIQDASSIASKILDTLSSSIVIGDNKLYVTTSIGISIYPDDGMDPLNLLKFADSAMYKAKDEGKNNYQYYDAKMTELAFERVVMEASIRAGIKNEEFIVHYQPQIDATTEKLIGMEALVRWQHPAMGLVPPARFISLAESTGLIVELDRYVMKSAMKQVASWYEDGLDPGVLALNLAVKQLQHKDFLSTLDRLIKETGCRSKWIELELTEGQIMLNPEEAVQILQRVSDMGIELAIDDFGTGYSSLAYLKRLPIDKLKIDQAFIRDLPDDDEDVGISRAVIALAKSLNLKIIAEGVETKAQKDFLIENGCDNIQGYYYSRPLAAEEFESTFLRKIKS